VCVKQSFYPVRRDVGFIKDTAVTYQLDIDVLSGNAYGPGGRKASGADDVYVDIEQMVSGRYGAIDWLPVMSTKTQQVYHARYHNCEPPRMIAMEPDSP